MFLYACLYFPNKYLKILSLKFAPKLMLGCIVSNCGTQAILRVQIDTIFEISGRNNFHRVLMPCSLPYTAAYTSTIIKLQVGIVCACPFWKRKGRYEYARSTYVGAGDFCSLDIPIKTTASNGKGYPLLPIGDSL